MHNFSFATAVTLLWALASPAQAQAAEIVVLAAAAVEEPLEAVVHAFEHDTGNKVAMTLGSVGAIQTKLKAGANADLVILSTALVTAAEKDGSARAGIHAVVGRVEIGVAVRDGTSVPDISNADAFKKRCWPPNRFPTRTRPAAGPPPSSSPGCWTGWASRTPSRANL
jgi:molybdate transport system substrate-binding protein